MNVVITGASGFLGRKLATALLERGALGASDGPDRRIDRLTLVDNVPQAPGSDPRVRHVTGDITDRNVLEHAVDAATDAVFHLAAVVSGQAERDFDLGLRVNFDASRSLLEICRQHGRVPRLVFTSSVGVYGGDLPERPGESTTPNPQTSYGAEKAMIELLLDDYSRRGFVDGRALRLPTISVRPGRPNAAASSFASGIIREPLNGVEAVCPVDPDTRLWLLSPPTAIKCLITGHDIAANALGTTRVINLPGLTVSVREMVDSLERIAGPDVVKRIRWERDPVISRMAQTWPGAVDASRALALGFPTDTNFDEIIRQYVRDELKAGATGEPGAYPTNALITSLMTKNAKNA